ncbi:TPA: hypothetical protein QDZ66_001338 [Pluralibacter gergoviae]|nr:hypothetical protein [Pluralibacter gergoviae]HDS1150608.1 hypothetical protein [Pluralibacter gergoviae]
MTKSATVNKKSIRLNFAAKLLSLSNASAPPPANSAFMILSFIPSAQNVAAENVFGRENELASENARLKRQLAEQAQELAILKKAATHFMKRLK